MRWSKRFFVALAAVVLTTTLAACGTADRPNLGGEKAVGDTEAPTTTVPPTEWQTKVATAAEPSIEVFGEPDAPAPALTIQKPGPGLQAAEDPLAFVVNQEQGDWLQVSLPIRPNGSTGWIRASEVTVEPAHELHIEVVLSEFKLALFDGEEMLLEAPVALGTEGTPTPEGEFFTTTVLQGYPQPSAYGVAAIGLSAFSETLDSFSGGPPQIAIHGTYGEDALGQRVSNGCIRVSNAVVEELVASLTPHLGVPVEIRA